MNKREIIRVDKSLADEIKDTSRSFGISNVDASKLIAKKLKDKKNFELYHL